MSCRLSCNCIAKWCIKWNVEQLAKNINKLSVEAAILSLYAGVFLDFVVAFELRIVVFTAEVSACKMIGSFGDVIIRSFPYDVIARAHLALLHSIHNLHGGILWQKLDWIFVLRLALVIRHCAGTCSRHLSSINSSSWIELSTCRRIEFHVLIYNDLTRHRAKNCSDRLFWVEKIVSCPVPSLPTAFLGLPAKWCRIFCFHCVRNDIGCRIGETILTICPKSVRALIFTNTLGFLLCEVLLFQLFGVRLNYQISWKNTMSLGKANF